MQTKITALIDANTVDVLDVSGRYGRWLAATEDGRLDLRWTHVTIDELAVIPDEDRRQRCLLVGASLCRMVPTGACVVGFSRLDFARIGDDSDAFDAFRAGNLKSTKDALICVTARMDGCSVVTDDKRMGKRAVAQGLEWLTCRDVDRRLGGA